MRHLGAPVGDMRLDQFVTVVAKVYSAQDEKRSIWDVWCHTIHHAAAIAEEVRKSPDGRKLLGEIADFSLWLFAIVEKLHGEIGKPKTINDPPQESIIRIKNTCSDLLWNKYPGICPGCFVRRTEKRRGCNVDFLDPCDCLLYEVKNLDQSEKRNRTRGLRALGNDNHTSKPKGIDEWQKTFARIFRANIRHLALRDMALHLLEEIGEMSDAMIRIYTYTEEDFRLGEPSWCQVWLEEQLADIFSRLFTLVEKLNLIRDAGHELDRQLNGAAIVQRKPIRLSEIIWNRYGSTNLGTFHCPHCAKPICACPIILVPPTRSVDELLENLFCMKYQ